LFVNSVAEVVENAVKIARYHRCRGGVICFDNAFHGRTLLILTLTSKVHPYKSPARPGARHLPGAFPYCHRCPWGLEYPRCREPCGEAYFEEDFFTRQVDLAEVAAVILEPVQGRGLNHPAKTEALGRRLREKPL
jgi:4-aminobutyrate aminotransferase/(S)-3-amino-2-methylpropionate transaminase